MSGARFASKRRLRETPVDLGPCTCPGDDREHDEAQVIAAYGVADLVTVAEYGLSVATERGGYNATAAEIMQVTLGTVAWTLRDEEGKPTEPTLAMVGALDSGTFLALLEALAPAWEAAQTTLPNEPAAPSPTGSQVSGSPTPTTPTPAASTTS